MLRTLGKNETIQTSHVGGFCPYWTLIDGSVVVADTADEIILALPEKQRVFDTASYVGLLQFNYMLGHRTLVKGISKIPWRAVLHGDGVVTRLPPIPHGTVRMSPVEASKKLRQCLEEEIYEACKDASEIYILLSGGLDSRIVAGILKKLEPQIKKNIHVATWGIEKSRDVVYARRIAEWYGWEFHYLPYDVELVWRNIERGAILGGCETTGMHYHANEWFSRTNKNDLVIAATYGDFIGRGIYNKTHISTHDFLKVRNTWRLIHPSIISRLIPIAQADIQTAHDLEKSNDRLTLIELENLENFVRRLLGHTKDDIRLYCRLFQAFTSTKLVSLMWSLAMDCRTDDVYFNLIKDLDSRLFTLPWANTGCGLDGTPEPDETLTLEFHDIGAWMRSYLKERLNELYFSRGLDELMVFSNPSKNFMWNKWVKEPLHSSGLSENIVKVAALEIARRHFKLRPEGNTLRTRDFIADMLKDKLGIGG
ncbi:MAG: hypothetical protein JW838_08510 [Spirochaetes bacterium]|nr:hypothetical protein [Spirochaetota bacterium]